MWPTEIKQNCRRIETGLPLKRGRAILESVIGQLSDGMWENSPRMERYWKFVCIDEGIDTAIICVSNKHLIYSLYKGGVIENAFLGKSDSEILLWFAEKIRQVAKEEEKWWPDEEFRIKEGNQGVSQCLGQDLTGDDVWSLRKGLIRLAKTIC